MSTAAIKSALTQAFVASALFSENKISFPNRKFTPPQVGPWAALHFSSQEASIASNGAGGLDRVDGFMQIDLNYPLDSGTGQISDMVDDLRVLFKAGTSFTYGGEYATVVSCSESAARKIESNFRVSVTVRFYSHINR
jgi:hypothetical protein